VLLQAVRHRRPGTGHRLPVDRRDQPIVGQRELSAVSCGQELAINNRDGPVEAVAAAGPYRLSGSFRIGVTQGCRSS
jgi:hypothetical protein